MSAQSAITPLQRLLRFPFQTPEWQNRFLIGSALLLASFVIPILPWFFVVGYTLQVMRQTLAGEAPFLPAWDDWGKLGKDGLVGALIALVYLLPGMLVFFGGYFVYTAMIVGMPFFEPSEAMLAGTMLTAMALFFVAIAIGSLLVILGWIPIPAATARYATTDRVGAAFELRAVWRLLREHGWPTFAAWVVLGGLVFIFYAVLLVLSYTIVFLCFTPFLLAPLVFYMSVVGAGLFGEVYGSGLGVRTAPSETSDEAV